MSLESKESKSEGPDYSARQLIDDTAMEESTWSIPLKNGKVILVRNIVNFRTLIKLRKRAQEIMTAARNGVGHPAWKPYIAQGPEPISPWLAEMMADFTALIVAPKFTETEVLELAFKNGIFAAFLHGKIKAKMEESVPAAEVEEIIESKNDLPPMDSDGPTSPSAETSSASIPTSSTTTNGTASTN